MILTMAIFAASFSLLLLIFFAYYTSGGIAEFVSGMTQGFNFARIMIGEKWGTVSDLLWKGRLRFDLVSKETIIFTASATSVLILKVLLNEFSCAKKNKLCYLTNGALTLVVTLSTMIIVCTFFYGELDNPSKTFKAIDWLVLTWAPLLLSTAIVIFFRAIKSEWNTEDSVITLILLMLPYSVVIGTSNAYVTSMTGGFIFIGLLTVHVQRNLDNLLIIGSFCVLVACLAMPINGRGMYRQPALVSISNNSDFQKIENGHLNGINVHSSVANYFLNINKLLSDAGFIKGSPVIDLTGASPGVLVAIQGRSVGAPWILGGNSGSDALAQKYLQNWLTADILSSWVIIEKGTRAIDHSVLNVKDISLDKHFVEVGKIVLPKNYGRSASTTGNIQTFYRPKKHQTLDL